MHALARLASACAHVMSSGALLAGVTRADDLSGLYTSEHWVAFQHGF